MTGASGAPLVEARALNRSFVAGQSLVHAVKDVSLSIYRGEWVGIVGPSGCGKSTLLNILGLVEAQSSGQLLIEGVLVSAQEERSAQKLRRAKIGYVFQAFNLLSTLSVRENVMLPCLLVGQSEDRAGARADTLLRELGLHHRESAMPATLSGGEMQRVAIARAVAHDPAFVIADEPTGNLDSNAGEHVLNLLSEIHRRGTAIIMATHSDVAMARCSRVLRMWDGAIAHG